MTTEVPKRDVTIASVGPVAGGPGSLARRLGRTLVLAAAIFAVPLAAEAQQQATKPARIGILWTSSQTGVASYRSAFARGLSELGYVEGRDITIENRYAEDQVEKLPELAAEIVRLGVNIVVTQGTPAARAAKLATSTIPVVFFNVGDPVASGLVASLSRPGGNATGLTIVTPELSAKRLELLKEAFPKVSRVAVLRDVAGAGADLQRVTAVAQSLGLRLQLLEIRSMNEIESAFAAARKERAEALLVLPSPVLNYQRRRLVDLAAADRIPASYQAREFVETGGLMSYGPHLPDAVQRAATYVDKILKGAKPADLPVEQPTKFELVVNAKTAKALGVAISPSVLARADEVIR